MILGSLDDTQTDKRIVGHELLGEVVELGADVTRVRIGDQVSAESHIVCGMCLQCLNGEPACLCQRQDYWDFP